MILYQRNHLKINIYKKNKFFIIIYFVVSGLPPTLGSNNFNKS